MIGRALRTTKDLCHSVPRHKAPLPSMAHSLGCGVPCHGTGRPCPAWLILRVVGCRASPVNTVNGPSTIFFMLGHLMYGWPGPIYTPTMQNTHNKSLIKCGPSPISFYTISIYPIV